jgi:hypothetical protein
LRSVSNQGLIAIPPPLKKSLAESQQAWHLRVTDT